MSTFTPTKALKTLLCLAPLCLASALAGGAGPIPAQSPPARPPAAVLPVTPVNINSALQSADVWEGTYQCGPETAGARLSHLGGQGHTLSGKFEFFPLSSASRWPYGAVKISGQFTNDMFTLSRADWVVKPQGFSLPSTLRYTASNNGRQLNITFIGEAAQALGCTGATLRRQ